MLRIVTSETCSNVYSLKLNNCLFLLLELPKCQHLVFLKVIIVHDIDVSDNAWWPVVSILGGEGAIAPSIKKYRGEHLFAPSMF